MPVQLKGKLTPSPIGLTVKVVFAAPEGKSQLGTIMMSKNAVSVLRTEGVSQAVPKCLLLKYITPF
jgi:hypothetical protein